MREEWDTHRELGCFRFEITYVTTYTSGPLGDERMTTLNATEARSKLYRLIDEATQSHKPVLITGKRGNAVLLSEQDWNAINETLYLVSIPGMRESIRQGLQTRLEDCGTELDW